MEIYFDNSATTRPLDEVLDYVYYLMKHVYGNPSSVHKLGIEAEKIIKKAKEYFFKYFDADKGDIIFTSGGTEANNLSILGSIENLKKFGNHLITSKIEHPSVLNVFKNLESKGFDVTYLNIDEFGRVKTDELFESIKKETILVSIMHVNNETGAINDIEKIGEKIKKINNKTIFHVDGTQSFGKLKIPCEKWKVDLFSCSAHKVNGPKGIGAIYCSDKVKLTPLFYGGGQQKNIRSGTENVPLVGGFGVAVKNSIDNFEKNYKIMKSVKDSLREKISTIDDVIINTDPNFSAPHILNASFLGVRSEVLLHALEADNIFISAGSACSSRKKNYSHVLKEMGLNEALLESAVRFSFGEFNTLDEVEICYNSLVKNVKLLRKFVRK